MKKKTVVQLSVPNFKTLVRAFATDNASLLECRRRSDGKVVALLCAAQHNEDGTVDMIPFAEMLQGNPSEQYDPPNLNGGFAEKS